MVERALERNLFTEADYKALELSPEFIEAALCRMEELAGGTGFIFTRPGESSVLLSRESRKVQIEFEAMDVYDFIPLGEGGPFWDLLIAQGFLDLIDVDSTLPRFISMLRPGGLFYFPITFDGYTSIEPEIDPNMDVLILNLYHQTMDDRAYRGAHFGRSKAGSHLLSLLSRGETRVLAVGSSDWMVFPEEEGKYRDDDAYFLHHIIHTVWEALAGNPQLDQTSFRDWIERRHDQIEAGELVYIAHQLDVVGRAPTPPSS